MPVAPPGPRCPGRASQSSQLRSSGSSEVPDSGSGRASLLPGEEGGGVQLAALTRDSLSVPSAQGLGRALTERPPARPPGSRPGPAPGAAAAAGGCPGPGPPSRAASGTWSRAPGQSAAAQPRGFLPPSAPRLPGPLGPGCSPEQELLPWLLPDDVQLIVVAQGARHLLVGHVHAVLGGKAATSPPLPTCPSQASVPMVPTPGMEQPGF